MSTRSIMRTATASSEPDFTYTNVVSMSDRLVFFRMMVGEIARKHGLFASWMPKPFADRTGSGAHYNVSLADDSDTNLFAAEDDPRGCGLTTLGYQFIAGVRALGRRAGPSRPPVLERHDITLDPARHEVRRDGELIALSPKEHTVLEVLMEADGAVVSPEELLERAWDEQVDPLTNSVRMVVMTLRRKMGRVSRHTFAASGRKRSNYPPREVP